MEEYHSRYIREMHSKRTPEQKAEAALKRQETIGNNNSSLGGKSIYRLYSLFDNDIKIQGFEHMVLDYLQYDLNYQDAIVCGRKTDGDQICR